MLETVETPEAYFGSTRETEIESSIVLFFSNHSVDPSTNKLQPNNAASHIAGLKGASLVARYKYS